MHIVNPKYTVKDVIEALRPFITKAEKDVKETKKHCEEMHYGTITVSWLCFTWEENHSVGRQLLALRAWEDAVKDHKCLVKQKEALELLDETTLVDLSLDEIHWLFVEKGDFQV